MDRPTFQRNGSQNLDENSIELKLEESPENDSAADLNSTRVRAVKDEPMSRSNTPLSASARTKSKQASSTPTPGLKSEDEETAVKYEDKDTNGHISFETNLPRSKKTSRASKKNPPRVAPLFDDLPDATEDANSLYQVIDACTYQNKYLGYTEHAMECDCSEEWDTSTSSNLACGEDSDCINRATRMECVDAQCSCGPACQNQRFGRRLYADVSVIKTEKKGHGLRANVPLKPGDFIYEYIGEVIAEGAFRKRMRQYDEEGIKHFYFMSLSKGEFVDATKKGNLGRFCNHSCNPNCYVDKWVVGDKLRMGIFAERNIKPGEELVFNYNVDRYGANPQPCYCDEDNCTGFIGGKTQTEKGTKLSTATIEALGIDDEDWDAWDTVTAKKPKKKKVTDDDDEDYVERAEARDLDVNGVTKVMAALMQCKEKWIAVRLLQRVQRVNDEDVLHRIVKLHGYRIFNSQLSAWSDDDNVILQILEILEKLPRLTRNKIVDAKIDQTLEPLKDSPDARVAVRAQYLVSEWSKLELGYRIPRKVRNAADSAATPVKYERRELAQQRRRSRSRSRSKTPPRGPSNIPKGPSGMTVPAGPRAAGTRPLPFARPPSAPFTRGPPPLPAGWFQAVDQSSRVYFYSAAGETTWKRPSQPAGKPPPPPKQPTQQDMLKSIIDGIVTSSEKEKKDSKQTTPDTPDVDKKEKQEKWRSLDEEKQKKLYENTLFPHISHVMNKYKHKIPKEDLKRFAKDLAKKLVNSDYKAGRVTDPTKINEKQQKKVKAYCKDYFDKAASKHKKLEEDKAARKERHTQSKAPSSQATPAQSPKPSIDQTPKKEEEDEEMKMSDVDDEPPSPSESMKNGSLKRKRSIDLHMIMKEEEDDLTMSPAKKMNMEVSFPTPPPPPPPAPPADPPFEHNSPGAEAETEAGMAELTADEEPDIHADTNFKSKSMADVRALAQLEADDEVDWGMDEDEGENGAKNPLVQEQPV